ncbi:MFS transporter [Seleniivibrio sp.]|uniref:MFS transporter n=1 Tax=Seleniivibrio sp. TaxID=2898801 RepID=UPI0025D3E1C1|nr:MFS transporter [Seleniivibrio sp.]MCD8553980.1 MFS transporter [Seleniivibrio sp.]
MLNNDSTDKAAARDRYLIPVLAAYYFLHYSTLGIIYPYFGFYFKQMGYTGTEIGIFLSILPVVSFTCTSLWADIFTRVKRRRLFMVTGILVSSFALVPIYFIHSKPLTAVLLAVFAFARTGILPVIDSFASSLNDRMPYGRVRIYGSAGFILTSTATGFFFDSFGAGAFILLYTFFSLLSVFPALLADYDTSLFKPRERSEKRLSPELKIFFAGVTIYLSSYAFLSNFFNIKVAEAGFGQTYAGYMWTVGVLAEMFFMYNQERVLKVMRVEYIMIISMLLGGVRYFATAMTDSLFLLFIFSAFHGFAYGTFHISIMKFFRTKLPEGLRLKAQTIYSGVGYGLGTVIGSFISGMVYDHMGLKPVFFTAFFFCIAGASVIYWYMGIEEKNGSKQG